ncbi:MULTISPECIES: aldehyde dehydrogenase (NADP(+)) [unclassified Pseudonocardia]|uniref:aldehyde dehydrogenase (NADP(+)) n=1 Tax=unclassified Pseudonocardia TaxID=2619320 RepID=UPI0009597C7D|nr:MULTISPECIES: aldehyde dehydrogenase (NADP(+)) [unclassified Pseudonocardia]MBN9102373.1 aldehyde dehydrogenase (NADP(+)) [Pseudonocardia sp.]OJY39290.1 MAG: aldehyde dehydrogenase (NADP(+)) [Pseudonocardia sp. 73-21]
MTTTENRPVAGTDPRTGQELPTGIVESTPDEVRATTAAALAVAPALAALDRTRRAGLLRSQADALESARGRIVEVADAETALGAARLNGELTRTAFQFRFFADVVDDGGFLEAAIDHAGPTPMGPRPDLRRMLVPIGPVAVFGASNFPLAFSVPGGDTASALAAGNPVVVKAHNSHPATAQLVHEVLTAALPAGALGLVFGREAGRQLVADPAIRAVGFTGSLSGGRALLDIIDARPDPVPFYGELSSLNALVVTEAAARERGAEIGAALVGSVTGSAGQLCTKPGLVLVPTGPAGDAVVDAAATALRAAEVVPLLNERIHHSYLADTEQLRSAPGVQTIATGRPTAAGFGVAPLLVGAAADAVPAEAFAEYFGPAVVVVRYAEPAELGSVIAQLPASLTATLHVGAGERVPDLVAALGRTAGRIVFDGFPTGVAVSWAQHHGGPWPATNSLHTSVGATAVRRFLRPLTWQDAPEHALPPELRDTPEPTLPRRVDGRLEPAVERS